MTATFDQVLATARKLSPRDRARLIAQLAQELVVAPAVLPTFDRKSYDAAWKHWDQVREELYQQGPASPSLAEQLDADRRERDALLMGQAAADDVHS